MQKDFITATPDSGGSGSTTVTATAPANQTESARSVNLSVAGGGMTRTVGASQAAGVVTWNYYFSVTPTSLSFVAGGETKAVTVTSYRKKVINGVETSTQENVSWSATISGTGFTKNTDGSSITAANNTGAARSGSVSYTQTTSGKTASVSLSQSAPRYTLTITGLNMETGYYMFKGTSIPVGNGTMYFQLMGGMGDHEENWGPSSPISVNDPTKQTGTTTCGVGDTLVVRTRSRNSWQMAGQIVLRAENQTLKV